MLQEQIKEATVKIFDCERANILFCDSDRGELYYNYLN